MFTPAKSKLLLFLSLLVYIFIAWFVFILPPSKFNQLAINIPSYINDYLVNIFPDDLVININKGTVELNRPSPYCLILEPKKKIGILFDLKASNLDPSDLTSTGSYSSLCNPIALVNKRYILYSDSENKGTYKLTPISETVNFSINKETLTNYINLILPKLISSGQILYYLAPILIILFFYSTFLFINIWYALIVKLFINLFKVRSPFSYSDSFDIALYFYIFLLFFDNVIVKYVINNLLNTPFSFDFMFRNTLFITLGSILYYIIQKPTPPLNPPSSFSEPPTTQNSNSTPTGQ